MFAQPRPGDLVVLGGVAGRRVRRRRGRVRLRARCHNNCSRQHPGASGLERDLASIAGILKVTITLLIDNRVRH